MLPREYVEGSRPSGRAARWLQRLVLERRYGMRRGSLRDVELPELGFGAPGRVREHIPSPWGVLARILRRDEITPQDVFIDIGCGMGPVLVEAAAHYDFRRVIGIDVVPQFTQVARETIDRARPRLRCREIDVVTADVLEYELPDDVTVAFMADPFRPPLFDAVIAKLVASVDRNPRRLRVVYSWPVEAGRLEQSGRARLVRYGRRIGRPWARTTELAMYEISASGDGARSAPAPASPRSARGGRRPLWERFANRRGSAVDRRHTPREPTIQITSSGPSRASRVVSRGSEQEVRSLRSAFERHDCVRLRQLFDRPLLERVQRHVDEGEFSVIAHPGMRTELVQQAKAAELLMLLVNDAHLFEHVRAITGCRRIGRFDGAVYRTMPDPKNEEPWHGEIFGHGMVEMSIDLSTQDYSGGMLEIRDRHTERVLHRESHTEPGDAVLVRLAPSLQHRVTAVEGGSSRTVYAGRFMRFKSGADSKLARSESRS